MRYIATTTKTESVAGTGCRAALDSMPRGALRYWEVDHFFKCPLAGMCLSDTEQKQLVKKSGLSVKKNTPFEIHEALVSSSECENRLSRRVDALLQRKYAKEAGYMRALDGPAFLSRFKEDFASGDYMGTLWAAATHPSLSAAIRREIFGEIHMSMHWSAEQRSRLMQKLSQKETALADARQEIREAVRQAKALVYENEALQRRQSELVAALAVSEKEQRDAKRSLVGVAVAAGAATLESENRQLKNQLVAMGSAIEQQQLAMADLVQKNQTLKESLAQQKALNAHYQMETRKVMGDLTAMSRCDPACPSFDLCRKRVLIVGGITRMASLYKELIEGSGGVFEYHDGYMKNGVKQLESRLKRADVVLCPVSCNSHAACSIVKNLAKKYNKTVHMMASSSLSAVSQVIRGDAGQKGTINLKLTRVPAHRIVFEGENGYAIAPRDSRVVVTAQKHNCQCSGDCVNCPCTAEKKAKQANVSRPQ